MTRKRKPKPILIEPMEARQLLQGVPSLGTPTTYPIQGGNAFPAFAAQNTSSTGDGKTVVFYAYNIPGAPDNSGLGNATDGRIAATVPNADGSFSTPFIHVLGTEDTNDKVTAYTEGDVNGDGIPDVVFLKGEYTYTPAGGAGQESYGPTVRVLLGTDGSYTGNSYSVGSLSTTQIFHLSNNPKLQATSIALGDVIGDGLPDLVVGYFYNNTIAVIPNDAGLFASTAITIGTNTTGTALLVNQGSPVSQVAVGNGPIALVANQDLNGDGDDDVVVANKLSNNISVLLSLGTGNFLPQKQYSLTSYTQPGIPSNQLVSVISYPTSLAVGDVNGDGVDDIVVGVKTVAERKRPVNGQYRYTQIVTGSVDVFLGNCTSQGVPNGTFKPAQVLPLGVNTYPISVTTADITGDGIPDIVTANVATRPHSSANAATAGTLDVLIANGGGVFQPTAETLPLSAIPAAVTPVNLTGDGRTGLIVTETGASVPTSANVEASFVAVYPNINEAQPGISLSGGVLTITGTPGNDTIVLSSTATAGSGTAGSGLSNAGATLTVVVNNTVTENFVQSNVGAISISGLGGNDSIVLGTGVPAVNANGNQGNDTISVSNSANNTLNGGNGADSIDLSGITGDSIAATGNNMAYGGPGDDTILAGDGNDTLNGGPDNDSLVGGAGDTLAGTGGVDVLIGGPGDDTLFAIGAGQSIPTTGFETLFGNGGNDSIAGGPGDSLVSGNGSDTVTLL